MRTYWIALIEPSLPPTRFRITQTEQQLIRRSVQGEDAAVRAQLIMPWAKKCAPPFKKIGGEMPEIFAASPIDQKTCSRKAQKADSPE